MLLIVNNSAPIDNPSSSAIQRALSGAVDVVLLDSQVPEQGYLQSGMIDEDEFDLEYITPTVYERVERPVSLSELISILQAFAKGANWRRHAPWKVVDEEMLYTAAASIQPSVIQNAFPSAGYLPRRRQRDTSRDQMRALNWLAVAAGWLVFPLVIAGLVALDTAYRSPIKDFGLLITALVFACLGIYVYFGLLPLRRAAARWWGRLLNVTIIETKDSARHVGRVGARTSYYWVAAEAGTGRDWLVTLLEFATIAVLAFGPFGSMILMVAAVKAL